MLELKPLVPCYKLSRGDWGCVFNKMEVTVICCWDQEPVRLFSHVSQLFLEHLTGGQRHYEYCHILYDLSHAPSFNFWSCFSHTFCHIHTFQLCGKWICICLKALITLHNACHIHSFTHIVRWWQRLPCQMATCSSGAIKCFLSNANRDIYMISHSHIHSHTSFRVQYLTQGHFTILIH